MTLSMEHDQAAIRLLQDLVSTPSINGTEGELVLARRIAAYLQEAGLDVQLRVLDDKRANVVASMPGRTDQGQIVWNGHLDTVALGEASAWSKGYAKAEICGERLYGRGSSDMKAGLAAMLFCLASWARKGHLPRLPIFFCATCDEERNGQGAEELLDLPTIREADMFLISEPTALDVCFAEKGCLRVQVQVYGKTSHAAYADQGINAVDYAIEFARIIQFGLAQSSHPLLGPSTAVITGIQAGTACNMVPDFADMLLDLRLVPGIAYSALQDMLEAAKDKLVSSTDGHLRIDLDLQNHREPIQLEDDNTWGKKILLASQELGLASAPCGINFFSDASVFRRVNKRAEMVLCGPGEPKMAHQPNEYVEIAKYLQYIDLLQTLFN